MINNIKNLLKKNKYGRYMIVGSFLFFLIKGLIWLVIIAFAWFGIGKI